MCGLFGYVAEDGASVDMGVVREIIRLASQRGPDGYGMFNGRDVVKRAGAFKPGDESFACNSVLIGHFRLHTVMGTSKDIGLLHPFVSLDGGMALAHNGSIKGWDGTVDGSRSDSEHLFKTLQAFGPDKVLEKLDGNFACSIYHGGKVYLHNGGSIPLHKKELGGVLYWCSKRF